MVLHSSICQLQEGDRSEFMWCSGIPQIYGLLEYGGHLPWIYVHTAIYEPDVV